MRMLIFSKKKLLLTSLCYIYIPVIIFLFGWTKLYIAIVCCIALLFWGGGFYNGTILRSRKRISTLGKVFFSLYCCV